MFGEDPGILDSAGREILGEAQSLVHHRFPELLRVGDYDGSDLRIAPGVLEIDLCYRYFKLVLQPAFERSNNLAFFFYRSDIGEIENKVQNRNNQKSTFLWEDFRYTVEVQLQ